MYGCVWIQVRYPLIFIIDIFPSPLPSIKLTNGFNCIQCFVCIDWKLVSHRWCLCTKTGRNASTIWRIPISTNVAVHCSGGKDSIDRSSHPQDQFNWNVWLQFFVCFSDIIDHKLALKNHSPHCPHWPDTERDSKYRTLTTEYRRKYDKHWFNYDGLKEQEKNVNTTYCSCSAGKEKRKTQKPNEFFALHFICFDLLNSWCSFNDI